MKPTLATILLTAVIIFLFIGCEKDKTVSVDEDKNDLFVW